MTSGETVIISAAAASGDALRVTPLRVKQQRRLFTLRASARHRNGDVVCVLEAADGGGDNGKRRVEVSRTESCDFPV